MADKGRKDVEILVHTTAPSRGQDDARYRALAQAYLDFQPAEIHSLSNAPENDAQDDLDTQANSQLLEELANSTWEERESEASYRPDDDLESGSVAQSSISVQDKVVGLESPVLSFSDALDNADSPVWRSWQVGPQGQANDLPANRPISQVSAEIADSQPEPNVTILALSSPARILELYLQGQESSGERSLSSDGIRGNQQGSGTSPELPSAIHHNQTRYDIAEEIPSLSSGTPSSPSPQKRQPSNSLRLSKPKRGTLPSTQDPAMSVKRKWPESNVEDIESSSSAPTKLSIESSTVTTRTTSSRKKQRTDGSVDELTKTKEVTSSKVTMVTTSSAPSSSPRSDWADKLEIRAPPPQTSINDLKPEMLVTINLKQLAQKMPMSTLYRPKLETRDLRPMERGHWIVSCGKWDLSLRKRFWECLGNFIGRGLVGWGIWSVRDEELDNIRVYCWGITVGHIYLLLYVASETRVKAVGARWIAGDGEAIITMPS